MELLKFLCSQLCIQYGQWAYPKVGGVMDVIKFKHIVAKVELEDSEC